MIMQQLHMHPLPATAIVHPPADVGTTPTNLNPFQANNNDPSSCILL
jgi:hypothetical protein